MVNVPRADIELCGRPISVAAASLLVDCCLCEPVGTSRCYYVLMLEDLLAPSFSPHPDRENAAGGRQTTQCCMLDGHGGTVACRWAFEVVAREIFIDFCCNFLCWQATFPRTVVTQTFHVNPPSAIIQLLFKRIRNQLLFKI